MSRSSRPKKPVCPLCAHYPSRVTCLTGRHSMGSINGAEVTTGHCNYCKGPHAGLDAPIPLWLLLTESQSSGVEACPCWPSGSTYTVLPRRICGVLHQSWTLGTVKSAAGSGGITALNLIGRMLIDLPELEQPFLERLKSYGGRPGNYEAVFDYPCREPPTATMLTVMLSSMV